MKLILMPAGKFSMGSPSDEQNSRPNERIHKVAISRSFYVATLEITEKQYAEVLELPPREIPEKNANGRVVRKRTVEFTNMPKLANWFDANRFCKQLSEHPEEKKQGRLYRLPTEAEWEYACRAGTQTAYHFGDDASQIGDYAWFRGNALRTRQKVSLGGLKRPNPWGLFDMYGNVQEWCEDLYRDEYPDDFVTDPVVKPRGTVINLTMIAVRGGNATSDASRCRSASRNKLYADDLAGFRVVMTTANTDTRLSPNP